MKWDELVRYFVIVHTCFVETFQRLERAGLISDISKICTYDNIYMMRTLYDIDKWENSGLLSQYPYLIMSTESQPVVTMHLPLQFRQLNLEVQ